MQITFWLFVAYVSFVFLMFIVLFIYGAYKRYSWWFIPGVLCLLTIAFAYDFYMVIFSPVVPNRESPYEQEFIIPRGTNLAGIGDILKNHGIIGNSNQFRWIASLLGYEKGLKAGKFKIDGSCSHFDLLQILNKGGNVHERVTIPEGLPTSQIISIICRSMNVDSAKFANLVYDSLLCSTLDIPSSNLDGFLLPETYYFNFGMDEEAIIRKMISQFKSILTDSANAKIDSSGMTLREYVILASIIEGEAVHDSERRLISAVFHNRLKRKIKLDADPTLQYIIPDGPRRLLNADKMIDSPYNTYKYRGLPPGPINNPGRRSILAAIFPADVEYLYFVAQGEGYHAFSETYNDHLNAKKKLDRLRRELDSEGDDQN